jgi:hypothetical protein
VDNTDNSPKFPLYIISKGRAESRLTSRALEVMGAPYRIVVEEQEYDQYAAVIDRKKILVLDKSFQRDYDAIVPLAEGESKGSGPVRNFCWEHSIREGHERHWVLDDNIGGFLRLNRNKKSYVHTGAYFRAMEDFCERYENVALAGPNYRFFAKQNQKLAPVILNTRIFSCILIDNRLPFRWRGRYNEDADLSLRVLKAGYCTVQFNAFLQNKIATQTMKGGNTDEIYADGTLRKSKLLVDLHPDVVRLTYRFGRIHHYADYRPFLSNRLIRKEGTPPTEAVNEYGMAYDPTPGSMTAVCPALKAP